MQESFQEKPKFLIKLSTNNSFITNSFARIRGIQVGLNFKKITKLGIGYHWLAKGIERPLEGIIPEACEVKGQLKTRYVAPFIEYVYLKRKRYEFSIPLQIGVGKGFFEYTDASGRKQQTPSHWLGFYEPSMTGIYKIIPYLGVGAGIGYRLLIFGGKHFDDRFTAPTYQIKVKIYFDQLLDEVK